MSFDLERIYALLPAIYRIRDIEIAQQAGGLLSEAELAKLQSLRLAPVPLSGAHAKTLQELEARSQGGPLKALMSVIAEQIAVLEDNLAQLYDDQFIETCAEWVVPYIGDLICARGLSVFPNAGFSQRAQVANTISYRRRKGTANVIQQLARDVTDWDASVVEYFKVLATTQYMKHLRPGNLSFCDLRDSEGLESIGTPVDRVAHTAEVRRIASGRGKYNIPNIGVFLYRLASFELTDVPAHPHPLDDRRYFFNPLGVDTQLYNLPVTQEDFAGLAGRANVALPIGRSLLDRNLDTYYGVDPKGKPKSILIKKDKVSVVAGDAAPGGSPPGPKLSDLIQVCDLRDVKKSGVVVGWAHQPADKIAIDPVLGRIAFPTNSPAPKSVHTTYHYGFSARMGGGEYGRIPTFSTDLEPVLRVPGDKATIQAALDHLAATGGGVVEINSNQTFVETPVIRVPAAKTIELRAADEFRPVLALSGPMVITGGDESAVTINGFLVTGGSLTVPKTTKTGAANQVHALNVFHCTLVPGQTGPISSPPKPPAAPGIVVQLANTSVTIESCITGPIQTVNDAEVTIRNSIVDATDEAEMAFGGLPGDDAGATLNLSNTTIIGKVHTLMIQLATNSIFLSSRKPIDPLSGPVVAERLQQGCVRFSYIPPGSLIPRPHQCQPQNPDDAGRVRPIFTSLRYGEAGYCQLSRSSAVEITEGADDGAEMGAFHDLYTPQRESNIRARLEEFLRFGLEAGVFYAS